jgi:hypothetical protein
MRAPIWAAVHVHHPRRDKYLRLLTCSLACLPPSSSSSSYPAPGLTHPPLRHSSFDSREYRSSHSPGILGAGPLASQADPITLNPCAAAIVILSVLLSACMPYLPCLPCPASLCHGLVMPCQWGSGRILFSLWNRRLCDMTVAHQAGVSVSWLRPSQYR